MKHLVPDPSLAAEELRSPRTKASTLLIQGAALLGLFVLASMVATAPVALRFIGGV